ncbi:16S rRNA (cytosine(1402)-N(4))-methyltransferase [Candidatus Daviesbacteria bacterium RIFCSPHIGHO2_02_FULL_39_12]|uniref:Ribosomal RNA small subunit methyltransferase H n=2 Tax=Candidatus Daviesiibacteriota TaxID=1752718 RepID=A0A1F5JC86_9BACT|nr:MAG: 16S rRNA (cytosine(1402)-N(4))-methyltransferase [Candidatus Daviesbacteria bacterium RIFCSPHIGHO2_02_FULL_39_12]OGE72033.1 MAG: 16S rRNA (cytosine(1402)-N(4))-methyltransferase [Candidatus Daviesbacteria bacterium RIFCSPLOWO2_02_FULL_38_15]
MEGYHSSVLLKEAVDALNIRDACHASERYGAWYLDCTLGDGGHSIEIISREGKVIGIDVDPQALERVQRRFKDLRISSDKFRLIQGNFRNIESLAQTDILGIEIAGAKLDLAGAIFDLGFSRLQLESPERGFSFSKMGPLDMRMDPALEVRALDLIKVLSRKELHELFSSLGEEKYSARLADALVSAREVKPVTTTKELADVIVRAVGRVRAVGEKIHPATRVFQALRIAVNDELAALSEGLNQVVKLIAEDGRIVVISFHSLEDRIVKNTFKEWEVKRIGQVLTKKPVGPTKKEIQENPRSRSAKMRVFEKL